MKKIIAILFITLCFTACTKEKKSTLTITGNVDGLKEGMLYLQQVKNDSVFTNIDSIMAEGDGQFTFHANIKEPTVLYLYLDTKEGEKNDDIVRFFAEKGKMTINTSLQQFQTKTTITGSENQKLLEKYQKTIVKLNERNNVLIQKNASVTKEGKDLFEKIQQNYEQLLRSKYLYTINFALNNKDKAIAPYLATHDIFNAQVSFLDTIYNALTPKIKTSLYGKQLKELLEERTKK